VGILAPDPRFFFFLYNPNPSCCSFFPFLPLPRKLPFDRANGLLLSPRIFVHASLSFSPGQAQSNQKEPKSRFPSFSFFFVPIAYPFFSLFFPCGFISTTSTTAPPFPLWPPPPVSSRRCVRHQYEGVTPLFLFFSGIFILFSFSTIVVYLLLTFWCRARSGLPLFPFPLHSLRLFFPLFSLPPPDSRINARAYKLVRIPRPLPPLFFFPPLALPADL